MLEVIVYGDKRVVYNVLDNGHWRYVGWIKKDDSIQLGYHRKQDGRPVISVYGLPWYVYRLVYEATFQDIEYGKVPDHTCLAKWCISPYHLEEVTQGVNMKRAGLLGGDAQVGQALKTHCPQGHEYNEENTYTTKRVRVRNGRTVRSTERQCKLCMRQNKRDHRALYRAMGLRYS